MLPDALLVLQRSDVLHLAALQASEPTCLDGCKLLFTDPGTLDDALRAGLKNHELRRLLVDRDLPARVFAQACSRSALIDQLLTTERQALFGAGLPAGTPFTGWDQSLLYLSLQRAFTAQALGQAVAAQFPETRIGLLRPDNAQLFNFDSLLSAEMAGADPTRFAFVGRYPAGRQHNPQLLALAWHGQAVAEQLQQQHGVDALVHIPTCFYDAATFGQAIRDRYGRILDLPGTYCDVPVQRSAALLTRLDDLPPSRWPAAVRRYRERALAVLREQLAPWLGNAHALQQQAALWADRCELQALNFHTLHEALAGHRPDFVLADHDTGHNGPLFSLAAALDSAITVLPHSGYTTSALPHSRRVTAVECVGFGAAVRSVLGQPVAVRPVRFRPAVQAMPRPAARRVCLLLNTMHSEGISYIDFYPLVAFYRQLAALCSEQGVELQVRLKPGAPALGVVSATFGLAAQALADTARLPIADLAQTSDICINYGEPTSGMLNFLDAASLVLHVSEQDWPADTLIAPPFMRDRLVASVQGARALDELRQWLAEPAHYAASQQSQQRAHQQRRKGEEAALFG